MMYQRYSLKVFQFNDDHGILELIPDQLYMPVHIGEDALSPFPIDENAARVYGSFGAAHEWLTYVGEIESNAGWSWNH